MVNLSLKAILLTCLAIAAFKSVGVASDQLTLASILPKLQAIHEDTKSLLLKNSELKTQILAGLQTQLKTQNDAKLKQTKQTQSFTNTQNSLPSTQTPSTSAPVVPQQPASAVGVNPSLTKQMEEKRVIDYAELEEFNRWVDVNLDYAVKNTQASIETLKEEAQQNNGNVDYTDEAIKDGIEGVKYWQSAVIFQDKTLKNEKFDVD